jgi:hypothetical protein
LIKLYKEVQSLLNLDPSKYDVAAIKQILSGLVSITNGIAAFRNSSSDSHALKFIPEKTHALLAVNASMTICDFLFATFQYQLKNKQITLIGSL